MVFEKIVVQLLDKYLSNYIENVDYKKLKLDVWNGNVELEKLYLKPNALADLHLPVMIKIGYLQKLTLQVPWKHFYTHPTKVTINGLYIVIIPKTEVEYDAKQEEDDRYKAKMKEIDRIEQFYQEKEEFDPTKKSDNTFGDRMKLQIIQNLQLSIHNIHIIYEDQTTKPDHPFSFGITLHSMTFQTTNQEWKPMVMKENTPTNYKLGQLNALSIYWNSDNKLNSNEIIKTLHSKIAIDHLHLPSNITYIVRPFNIQAKLIMTLNPRQQNFERPIFHISIDLDHMSLNLTRSQYLDILDFLEYQDYTTAKLKYIKYRLKKLHNPKEKWIFAYNAIVNEIIKPRFDCYKWKNIQMHLKYSKEYRAIYFQALIGKITNEQKQRAEILEKQLDVFNLTYIRRRAQIEAKKQPKTFRKAIVNWWSGKSKSKDNQFDFDNIMSDEEKKIFYQTIGYENEDTSKSTYPKEYVDIDLIVRLMVLDLNIWSNDRELQLITQAILPNTEFIFRRRPATSSALFIFNLSSFQVFGCSNQSNENPPLLIQSIISTNLKLLEVEFAINPIDKDSGYRLQVISQSLEIKYHTPTIDKLVRCFRNETQHNLKGVKQAASNMKYQSMVLLKQNVENAKVLDIYIDLQSSYIILPENGIYYDGCSVLCLDMGHLIFQQNKDQSIDHYINYRLELKKFQLIYANHNENWQIARMESNNRLHLIEPITFYGNLLKCLYSNQIQYPLWKISGQIPDVNIRISDMRLFQIIQHLQSFSFPQSEKIDVSKPLNWSITPTKLTLETLVSLTEEKSNNFIKFEGNFELSHINLIVEETKNENENSFLRLSLISICSQILIKTFSTEFQASLDDFIIFHEQFITKNNQPLRLLAAQSNQESKKLVMIHIMNTSSDDGRSQNNIHIHLSKFVMILQLEALLSIMRFQDNLTRKWPKEQLIIKKKLHENKLIDRQNSTNSTVLTIKTNLEEFRIVVTTLNASIFDISVQGISANIHRTIQQIAINLILTDFCLLDPNIETQYRKIISQQIPDQQLLSISIILYNYPKKHLRTLDDIDCDVKIHSTKVNIILIYKHINQLMEFIDLLNISQAAIELASNKVDVVYEQVEKFKNQAFKFRINATFNAPTILIPINSTSNEGLFLDFGQLIIQTIFLDDPQKFLVEQQQIIIDNVLASRVRIDKFNEIQSEIILLECTKLQMNIDRLLDYQQVKNKPYISINMQWNFIHFRMGNDDYLCIMKIFMENFNDKILSNINREQYNYRQEYQRREEENIRKAVIKTQTKCKTEEILEKIRIHIDIQQLALTLYLDKLNLIERHVQHAENSKLAYIAIDTLQIIIHQMSNSSYKILIRIKNILCDDLREIHRMDTITRIINQYQIVDPNIFMFIASLEYKPKDQTMNINQRYLNVQLENFYLCLKIDYLMMIYKFFMENLPEISQEKNSSKTIHSKLDNEMKTEVNMIIKNPEILLLETQRQSITNCLVLNFALVTTIVNIGNTTEIFSGIKNLTIFSSKFPEISNSKEKYQILHPTKIDLDITWDSNIHNINVQFSDILMNIAPAAVGIVMTVMNSLNNNQTNDTSDEFDVQTMFEPKSFDEGKFWFLKEIDNKNILSKHSKGNKTNIIEQCIISLKTIEIKFDLEFDSQTKSVVAMYLSNSTINLIDWSNQMTFLSTMDIEAALYNEHTLAWEPFIEPIIRQNNFHFLPLNINFSIKPIHSTIQNDLQVQQLISLSINDYLNITITKTAYHLLNYLLNVFGNFHKQNLPKTLHNQPELSLINAIGKSIFISNLHGLEFTEDSLWTSIILEEYNSIALTVSTERSSLAHRLSVMEEQTIKNRQEFLIQINNTKKLININRTWQRIYNLSTSPSIQILCDTQVHHNRRRVILSSIVKIHNETNFSIFILDFDCISGKSHYQIKSNEEFYIPIDLLVQTSSIYINIAENDQPDLSNDILIFDWKTNENQEEEIHLKTGHIVYFIFHKETKQAYAENTDQLNQISYCIYIESAMRLTNLLPIELQCIIQHHEIISCQSNQTYLIKSGNKNSVLQFIIPFCDQLKWVSDPIDLKMKQKHNNNERIIIFHYQKRILRVVLQIKNYRGALDLTIYTPFWLINHTQRKLEFRIGNENMHIEKINQAFIICPENYKSDANEKGQIRLDESGINWSEKFSLDVIKSTGMATCKGSNDKTYMICVDIATSSFGLTKILTLSPAMVIINETTIGLEVMEIVMNQEQTKWLGIEPNGGVIPFWPENIKDSVMYVRYVHNRKILQSFPMNKQHQTLLYMHDKKQLVIFVEVIATDFDGVRIIFSHYKSGDAPLLVVNHTKTQMISFVQKNEKEVHYLVPQHFVFFTWHNPLKSREIIVSCNENSKTIQLHPHHDILNENKKCDRIDYIIFIDGLQTVLLITDNQQIIQMILNIPLSNQSITRQFQIGILDVGLSIVNDRTREELIYISLNQSKIQWVEMRKSHRKPLPLNIQILLEQIYQTHPNAHTKYSISGFREVTFHRDNAQLITQKGEYKTAKRQSFYGLWIEYTWSATNVALYASIYRLQIDNQLDHTSFPSVLYPVLPKTTDSNLLDKLFIELSIYETKQAQSNIRHIQYCKLLIQEFALRIEQGLIAAILGFFKEENSMMPLIDMQKDLEYINRSLRSHIKMQIDSPSNETPMYFDNIHLSPLKIHVSFSMHGSTSNEQLFAEYPLVEFLLKTLNIAEVQDVVLRLGYYERSFNRYTITKLKNEVLSHYQNQFFKQIHVLIFGLDVLGNPLGIIRGLVEGVESFFYEPYKGAIEGPVEFAEGVATGVLTLVGSTVGTTAGAIGKIMGSIGQSLATLTFDEEYQNARIRRKGSIGNPMTDIAVEGTNVFKGFVDGITGIVTKPIVGAKHGGIPGLFTGIGKGIVGAVAQPTGAVIDFASTSLDVIKRTTTQEQVVQRIRYPRHIAHDGLVRPYISHEAMGVYILNRLKHNDIGTYVAHMACISNSSSWLMATSKQFLYISEVSFLDIYEVHWRIHYIDLQEMPVILSEKQVIQILIQSNKNHSSGKFVKYENIIEAKYFIDKTMNTMRSIGL